jgi:hypothetical protein
LIFEGLKKGEEPFDEIDAGLKASVLAYYNLLKADEAYYNKNFATSLRILSSINSSLLERKDAALLSKLKFRSKIRRLVPQF